MAVDDDFEAGRRLYQGVGTTVQSCRACHGLSGEGGTEGGTAIPAIAMMIGDGRRFDSAADLCRAIGKGEAPDRRRLSRSMPRYTFDTGQCRALFHYLVSRGVMPPPGISADQIVVRLTPAHMTVSQRRWRDVLVEQIDRANRDGGSYGRHIAVEDGHGPATFLIALEPVGPLDPGTGVRIALRDGGSDPAARAIESRSEDEAAALLNAVAVAGAERIRWIDDDAVGPAPDEIEILASAKGLRLVTDLDCSRPEKLAVVIVSRHGSLDRTCALVPRLMVDLRWVPLDMLPQILPDRPGGTTIALFTAVPLDLAFSAAPTVIADIILETTQMMTANPSEQRLLAAFDEAWRRRADDRASLYKGVSIQIVDWPTFAATTRPIWVSRPD